MTLHTHHTRQCRTHLKSTGGIYEQKSLKYGLCSSMEILIEAVAYIAIRGSHGNRCQGCRLLRCDAMQSGRQIPLQEPALQMKAESSSARSTSIYRTRSHHIPQDRGLILPAILAYFKREVWSVAQSKNYYRFTETMPTVREREKFCSFIQYNQIIAENLVEDSIRQFGNHDVPGFSL